MPIFFTIAIALMVLLGISIPVTHLFWPEIIEGQVGKQSFVAHMIESWMKGDTVGGFPIRFFAEPWHAGPGPWAEEVPLFHWVAAAIGQVFGMSAVHAGRLTSFLFALLLLQSVRGLAKILFPAPPPSLSQPVSRASKTALMSVWLAPALLIWLPGFQIYSASVIPDLAMVAMIALAYWLRLKSGDRTAPRVATYGVLLIACLLKYFAFFALLAVFIYDYLAAREAPPEARLKIRVRALVLSALAGLPTLAYLYYFISRHIPNPITEYIGSNGYGHLAGPFLFHLHFYQRFVTWVVVKIPTLVLSLSGIAGLILSRRRAADDRRSELYRPGWLLIDLHFCCYVLFALIFASSFYVHDYYSLPFLLPVLFYACILISRLLNDQRPKQILGALIVGSVMTMGYLLSRDATFRLTNYLAAAAEVREALAGIQDRNPKEMVIYSSDFSLPVIPILSRKAGWAFNAEELASQKADLLAKLNLPETRAFVFYAREPGASILFERWKAADPRLEAMKVIADKSWPSEGYKGSATRLIVMRPSQ